MFIMKKRPIRSFLPLAILGFAALAGGPLSAWTYQGPAPQVSKQLLLDAEGEAAVNTVTLLHELAVIESNVLIAILFVHEGKVDPASTHLSDPLTQVWPGLREPLLAAGAEDFGLLLQQLAEAKSASEIESTGQQVLAAVIKARGALKPTDSDIGASVRELIQEAAGLLNPSGPTPVAAYQDAWALVSVAREEADLLARSSDPDIAKSAVKIILALDDIILSMPDPATFAPVTYDPAPITESANQIAKLLDNAA